MAYTKPKPLPRPDLGAPSVLALGSLGLLALVLLLSRFMTFNAATESKISTLSPLFKLRLRVFLALVKKNFGYEPLITSARRTAAQQAALHLLDNRNPAPNLARPDTHMRGEAADIDFFKDGLLVLGKHTPAALWAPVVAISDGLGLTWGGRFHTKTGALYADNNHFDGR